MPVYPWEDRFRFSEKGLMLIDTLPIMDSGLNKTGLAEKVKGADHEQLRN